MLLIERKEKIDFSLRSSLEPKTAVFEMFYLEIESNKNNQYKTDVIIFMEITKHPHKNNHNTNFQIRESQMFETF